MRVGALDPSDRRVCRVNVASPAALLVAKLHKIGERAETLDRLIDKDAHDLYRLLVAIATERLAAALLRLRADSFAGGVTRAAVELLKELFADGPDALGSMMAGRAERGIGDPAVVSAATATLAADLLAALGPVARLVRWGRVGLRLGVLRDGRMMRLRLGFMGGSGGLGGALWGGRVRPRAGCAGGGEAEGEDEQKEGTPEGDEYEEDEGHGRQTCRGGLRPGEPARHGTSRCRVGRVVQLALT